MSATATVIVIIFIVASMAGIGLQTHLVTVGRVWQRWGFLARALTANLVIIPLIGWIIASLVPMSADARAALLLLAFAPGGPSALQFTSKQPKALAVAAVLAFTLSLLSVVIAPLLIGLAAPPGVRLVVPYARVFWLIVLLLVLPLAAGMAVQSYARPLAARIVKPVAMIGTIGFVAFVVDTFSERRQAMGTLTAGDLLAAIGFILACGGIGWLMGGPDRATRRVLASASSIRNVALCLAIATRSFPGLSIEVPLAAFSALMIPPNFLFLLGTLLRDRRSREKRHD